MRNSKSQLFGRKQQLSHPYRSENMPQPAHAKHSPNHPNHNRHNRHNHQDHNHNHNHNHNPNHHIDASRSRLALSMALKGLLGNRRAEHAHHNQHHHHHHQQPASSSNAQHEFTFKWGNKRRQVFGTRAANLHDTSLVSSSSAVSNDAPPLRYSNANLRVAGWLTKRGKRLGSRVDRYFELNGSVLSNARSEHSNPTWTVNVRGSKVLAGPGREIIFKVDKSFTSFFAPTDELHDKWIKALQAVCADVTDFYDFGKVIGRGAYSEVYLARDKQRNELCAIKVLERSNTEHAKLIDRELEVLRLLNHQNIVQIYDIFDSARETFVVMEYLAGGELLEMITENDHLSEKNSKQVIREVLQAVHYLHARGIVHRDVKPENILCVNRGWPLRVKITDFGLSKSVGGLGDDDAQRVMRSQCGTAYYLAPEIANSLPYGKPVDLWACGVVLYVMLAGKFPFYGKSGDKFMRRLRAGVRFPEEEWNGISADAKALVRGLLDPSPASRLTAAQALEHRWLVDEADVTASSMPSRAVVEAQQKVQRRFNAATEPLSLQLAQFSASNRRARARTGGALEVGEMEETGAGVVRTDDHEEVYAGGSSDGGAMDGNKSELVLEPQLIVDHEV